MNSSSLLRASLLVILPCVTWSMIHAQILVQAGPVMPGDSATKGKRGQMSLSASQYPGWRPQIQNSFLNLTPGSVSWCRIKARREGAESAWSNMEYSLQETLPLNPPTGVADSDRTITDSVQVTWNAAISATNGEEYHATSAEGTKTAVTPWLAGINYDDTTATAAATYYYSVRSAADSSGGRSGDFSLFETGRRASPPLVPPTGVSATDGTICGLVRVSWNQVVGATNYQVYRASSATGMKITISLWQAGTKFDDTTALGGSAYYYWVKAAMDGGGGGASDFSTSDRGYAGMAPPVPAGVAASDGTYVGVVRVTWNASTDATGYEVYRDGTLVGITASSPFDDVPGDTSVHQYTVKAFNVCGTGAAGIPDGGSAGVICPQTPLLTGTTLGTLRNNYTGWVGIRFVVGSSPLQVRALGRIYVNGNTQTHELRLIHAATKATVVSVLWTPAGGIHNQISYAPLAAPATLSANTEYYLASKETAGDDSF
jgi:fibronectin type 3 domain-containing protein